MKHKLQKKYKDRKGVVFANRCSICMNKWKTNNFSKNCSGDPFSELKKKSPGKKTKSKKKSPGKKTTKVNTRSKLMKTPHLASMVEGGAYTLYRDSEGKIKLRR